jgi:hypothetical protein
MFALQSPVGLRFGATTQVDAELITFEMDLKIPKGTECPFRMELSGSEQTVMGTIRIERVLPKRSGSTPRYTGRIIEMGMEDREAFDGWRRDLATGGVSRHIERDPEAVKAQLSGKMMSGLSEQEAKAVLDRMNKRRSGYAAPSAPEGVDFGLAEEDTGLTTERENVREQLKATQAEEVVSAPPEEAEPVELNTAGFATIDLDIEEPEPSAPEPESSPGWMPKPKDTQLPEPAVAPPPTVEETKVESPVAPSVEEPSTPPMVVVNADANPLEITVIYLSSESYTADYKKTLHTSGLTIDHPELQELYRPVNVKLQLANGDAVETIGHTVALTADGMAVAMEFDPDQRAMLKRSAEDG